MPILKNTLMCNPKLFETNLSGKTYIVTGANSGIGFETTKQLVKQGAHVIMACRNLKDASLKKEIIIEQSSKGSIHIIKLDLADIDSITFFCQLFLSQYKSLHGLINNAGVMAPKFMRTKNNFELQFGVNHLGHFLLTHLLQETLIKSSPARIVCLSSSAHDSLPGMIKYAQIDFEDLNYEKRKYNKWEAYCQSKFANYLHAKSLAKKLGKHGVTAVSVHPGFVRTQLQRHVTPAWVDQYFSWFFKYAIGIIDPWEGAQATLHTVLDEKVKQQNGEFFSQTGFYRDKINFKGGWPMKSPNPKAEDLEVEKKLWDISCKLLKI